MKLNPIVQNVIVKSSEGTDMSTWELMKESSQIIVNVAKFVKDLFFNPVELFEKGVVMLQSNITSITLVILAVIILLKMIGFKNLEKWGILSLIVYVVIMVL